MTPSSDPTPFAALLARCAPEWEAYCQHEFVRRLADGTLPAGSFRRYLRQDYLFLVHFARAWGLAVYKSRTIAELRQGLDSLKAIVDLEMGLHVALAPCLVGYADIARWIEAQPFTVRGPANPYEDWIAMYASEEFQAAARAERDWLDARLAGQTAERLDGLAATFRDATRLELDFWQLGLDGA